jgi:A/G-specific adenine glycosylase
MDFSTSIKIQEKLLVWYRLNARSLPWRGMRDPYLIWVSEVMLQQTRVETVIPYFQQWTVRFPDIQSVACAPIDEILKAWEGLGYYSRARNIKKTAEIILTQFAGNLPSTSIDLIKLPGIGDYIAGAIASIGFGFDEPALDANGVRVISRIYDFHGQVNKAANKKILKENLRELLPKGSAGDFNQAVMDLGSMVCVSANPKCECCPIQRECLAFSVNTQKDLPVGMIRTKKPHFNVVAGIIEKNGKLLIGKRPTNGLLGGMWEFPGGKIEEGENHQMALKRELEEELGIDVILRDAFGEYKHAYTHFSVTVFPYFVEIVGSDPIARVAEKIEWASINTLNEYPMGKVDRSISNNLQNQLNARSPISYNKDDDRKDFFF